jgi:branched-chain amino acid transport system ATP-binding protein
VLEARDLLVFFENMVALNNVSLDCKEGEIVGVFGANSAGKSTLMHALSGILLDIRDKERRRGGERVSIFGDILYQGESIRECKASERARRGIILCPERRRLFAESTVRENLRMGAYLATALERRRTEELVFEIFPSLIALGGRRAGFLSGGEQQMVAIGRALMAQPRLLLLDEPLLGLAPALRSSLGKAIARIRDERQLAVLVSEQFARPLMPFVDRALILENGSPVLHGSRDELAQNPDVISAYFGL